MAHHLGAFFSASIAGPAGTYTPLAPVVDSFLTVTPSNRFSLPGGPTGQLSNWRLRWGYCQATGQTVARVFNAYMRRIQLPEVRPIAAALAVPTAFRVCDWQTRGPYVPFSDDFGIDADGTATSQQIGLLGLHDGNLALPTGEEFSVPFLAVNGGSTTQATITAGTWAQCNISFNQQTLPPGRYAITGLDVQGTGVIAARFLAQNAGPRPGCLGRATTAVFPQEQFRHGNLGVWQEFVAYGAPLLEVLGGTAGTVAVNCVMDVIKIG